jgi:hypothetical protein
MKTIAVECRKCGNVDQVEDSLIMLAMHDCTVCHAEGGRIKLEESSRRKQTDTDSPPA